MYMKRTIKRITRTGMLAVALILCATGQALAVSKPVAIWNGDFAAGAAGARGGYVINPNGNTLSADCITLDGASGGVIITNDTINTVNSNYPILAAVGLEGISYSTTRTGIETLITTYDSNGKTDSSAANYSGLAFWSGTDYDTYKLITTYSGVNKWTTNANYSDNLWPNDGGLHYLGVSFVADADYSYNGWRSYIDRGNSSYTTTPCSGANDPNKKMYGVTIGGTTTGNRLMVQESSNAKVKYVAIIRSKTNTEEDAKYWSLTDMTKAASSLASSDANTGVNLADNDTLAGPINAAAVFVQENSTVTISDASAMLTIGGGTGPLYVADDKTLTIDLNNITIPTAENPYVILLNGRVFGNVVFTNVPSNVIVCKGGQGDNIGILLKSVYTDRLSGWGSNDQTVIAWRQATATGLHQSNVAPVNTETGEIGDTYSLRSAWSSLFSDKGKGGVIVYDDPTKVCGASISFQWFTPGGLFVMVPGGALYSDGGSYRQLKLGNPTSDVPTWYVLTRSFTMSPFYDSRYPNYIYREVHFQMLGGAVLTLPPTAIELNNNAKLVMHGDGKIATAGTLTATGHVLDYSNLAPDRVDAFIDATLAFDNTTTFKFPANVEFPYPIATTITQQEPVAAPYQIGDVAGSKSLVFNILDGMASELGTININSAGTTYKWSERGSADAAYLVTVTESATLDIDTEGVSLSRIIFDVASGKTLTLTGSTINAGMITVKGDGYVKTANGLMLSGTLFGGGTLVYNGAVPTGLTFSNSNWTGTMWLENATGVTDFNPASYGNGTSKVQLTGLSASLVASNVEYGGPVILTNTSSSGETASYALEITGGNANNTLTLSNVQGSGTIHTTSGAPGHLIWIKNNYTDFEGSINNEGDAKIRIGTGTGVVSGTGWILVTTGAQATVAETSSWFSKNGITIRASETRGDGTANFTNNGTITGALTVSDDSQDSKLTNNGTINATTLDLTHGRITNTGTINVSGTATIGAAGTLTISGGTATIVNLVVSGTVTGTCNGGGSGTLTLNTASTATYTGYTTLNIAAEVSQGDTGLALSVLTLGAGATYATDAGKEGAVLFNGAGSTLTLAATDDQVKTIGHTPAVYGSGTVTYTCGDSVYGYLTLRGYVLVPYYNRWAPSGATHTLSADSCWPYLTGEGRLPASGNVAFDVGGASEVEITVDSTKTYTEGMVYYSKDEDASKSGKFVRSGANTITFAKLVVAGGTMLTLNSTSGVSVTGSIVVEEGATLILDGYVPTVNITGSGTVKLLGGITLSAAISVDPAIQVEGTATLNASTAALTIKSTVAVTATGNFTVSGTISGAGASGAISVASGGVLTTSNLTATGGILMNGSLTATGALNVTELYVSGTATLTDATLSDTTVTGANTGVVIYSGKLPQTNIGWTSRNWKGVVWIKGKSDITGFYTDPYGNVLSKVKVSGCRGWISTSDTSSVELVLDDDVYSYAFLADNGNSPQNNDTNKNRCSTIKKLSGSGTLAGGAANAAWPVIRVYDASGFTGSINCLMSSGTSIGVLFCNEGEVLPDSIFNLFYGKEQQIYVSAGRTGDKAITIAAGRTWTARHGITVAGTLCVSGNASISAPVNVAASGKLDLSTATSAPRISGKLTVDENSQFALPAGTVFPYSVATSATEASISGTYTVGGQAGTASLMLSSSGKLYPAAVATTFAGGVDPVSWSALGWAPNYGDATDMGECSLTMAGNATGTINLGSVTAGKVSITVPSDSTLTLSGTLNASEINLIGGGTVVCSAGNTLQGTIKGDSAITISYPSNTLPDVTTEGAKAVFTDPAWTGTVVINNYRKYTNVDSDDNKFVRFHEYGNANSKIKAPGLQGYAYMNGSAESVIRCEAEIVIDSETNFEFWDGKTGAGIKFRKLSGDGKLRLDGNETRDTQYIFEDVGGFAGDVDITDPSQGKKSFIFGPQNNEIIGSMYPANLVIATNVTVAANKTWDIPAGIIINDGNTLTLNDGAKISLISERSEGKLVVANSATASVLAPENSVTKTTLKTELEIGSGATLCVSNTAIHELTIPADTGVTYTNSGILDFSKCSSLETLHLTLGASKNVDLDKILLPASCTNVVYDIGSVRDLSGYTLPSADGTNYYYYATETPDEYASGGFIVSNVTAGAVWLIRQNGALIKTTENGTDRTYSGGRSFAGAACWHEWDFEQTEVANKLQDSGACTTNGSSVIRADLTAVSVKETDYTTCRVEVQDESKTILSSAVHPSAVLSLSAPWSMALRCSMPTVTEGKAVAISFGEATSGILGLASGADGSVEMFNWTNGVYTTLAKLQVEAPSNKDNMHIYVFTVEVKDAKNYVSFYRDGEFIHKAEFALTSSIEKFKIGDVFYTGDRPTTLPSAADSGYVDYLRLYDKNLPEADIEGLSRRRPFVSAYKTYTREFNTATDWKRDGEWVNSTNSTVCVANPEDGAQVVLIGAAGDAESETQVTVNLDAPSAYGTLIFEGVSGFRLVKEEGTKRVSAGTVVVRTPTYIQYGTVDFTHSMVGIDEGASLTFDLTQYPFEDVLVQTNVYITGEVVARSYDPGVDSRIRVTNKPSHTWAVTDMLYDDANKGYYVTITPNHDAGGDIYYKEGYITAGMTGDGGTDIGKVFSDAAFQNKTTLFEGDTVVISDSSTLGSNNNAWISDAFNGNLKVTRGTLNLMPGAANNGILNNRTITVESGKILNLKAQSTNEGIRTFNFGDLTLNGAGTINLKDNVTVASLSGSANITIDTGVTLTITSLSGVFTGKILGTGTVKLPAIVDAASFNFDAYGNSGSTVELTSFSGTVANSVTTTLKLDGDMTITSLTANETYSFARITGEGDLEFPSSATPASITIGEVVDYDGTLINNNATGITVGKISLPEDVVGGTKLLKKTGRVTVNAVYVNGADASMALVYKDDGVYKASASYGGVNYLTIAEAIEVATDANLAGITVFDENAKLPSGYYAYNGMVVKGVAATVRGAAVTGYDTLQAAVDAADMNTYVVAYADGNATSAADSLYMVENGYTINIVSTKAGSGAFVPKFDMSTIAQGLFMYQPEDVAATFTWTGSTGDELWATIGNWTSADGIVSSAPAKDLFTIEFNSSANVTLRSNVSAKGINIAGNVRFIAGKDTSPTITVGSDHIVLTTKDTTLTVTGVALSDEPVTSVLGAKVISETLGDGSTTYKVVYGTIFSVW